MNRLIPILLIFILFCLPGCEKKGTGNNPAPDGTPKTIDNSARNAEFEDIVKEHLDRMRIGLERFAAKNKGYYPEEISLILEHLGMDNLFTNPFTNAPMVNIKFGTKPYEGEFVYIPVASEGNVTGYFLFAFGSEETEGMDLNNDRRDDKVIVLFSNSTEGFELPTIKDALDMLRKTRK